MPVICGDRLIRELPREQLWLGQQFKATRETQADDTWQKSIINNRYSTQRDRGREALTHRGVGYRPRGAGVADFVMMVRVCHPLSAALTGRMGLCPQSPPRPYPPCSLTPLLTLHWCPYLRVAVVVGTCTTWAITCLGRVVRRAGSGPTPSTSTTPSCTIHTPQSTHHTRAGSLRSQPLDQAGPVSSMSGSSPPYPPHPSFPPGVTMAS